MLKRHERLMRVYSPVTDEGGGRLLGFFPMAIHFRTSEEIGTEDAEYVNLRYAGYTGVHRAPNGGFTRGMVIDDCGVKYTVTVANRTDRYWILKLERAEMSH